MGDTRTISNITVRRPEPKELERLGVFTWPVWTKEMSEFDWHYDDQETCYFLEGEVYVTTDEGEVRVGLGDLVTFPKGLSCHWRINSPVRKHYTFG